MSNSNLAQYIPLAVTGLGVYLLVKRTGAGLWQVLAAVLLGVILAGSILGPGISNLISQLTHGYLH